MAKNHVSSFSLTIGPSNHLSLFLLVAAKTLLFIRVARAIKIIAAPVDPRVAGNQMVFSLSQKKNRENRILELISDSAPYQFLLFSWLIFIDKCRKNIKCINDKLVWGKKNFQRERFSHYFWLTGFKERGTSFQNFVIQKLLEKNILPGPDECAGSFLTLLFLADRFREARNKINDLKRSLIHAENFDIKNRRNFNI